MHPAKQPGTATASSAATSTNATAEQQLPAGDRAAGTRDRASNAA
jgi:hypothetical protein